MASTQVGFRVSIWVRIRVWIRVRVRLGWYFGCSYIEKGPVSLSVRESYRYILNKPAALAVIEIQIKIQKVGLLLLTIYRKRGLHMEKRICHSIQQH